MIDDARLAEPARASRSPYRAESSPAPRWRQENILNVGKYTQLGSYDPHAGALDTLWWTGNNFYESLLDLNEDLSGLRPVLATSWTVSQGRQDLHVQAARGRQVQRRDPVRLGRGQALGGAGPGAEEGRVPLRSSRSRRVETPSPSTVVFHLEQPNNTFLPGLRFLLSSAPRRSRSRTRATRPRAGCASTRPAPGAYVLEKWEPNIISVGKKNPHYWRGWPANKFTTMNLRHIYEPETQRLMIEKGELDWSENVTKDSLPALKRNPNLTVYEKLGTSLMVTYLNTNVGPTKDLRVRQAIHHLWNQEAFNAITGNAANPGPLFTPILGKDWKMENPYPYDPAQGQEAPGRRRLPERRVHAALPVAEGRRRQARDLRADAGRAEQAEHQGGVLRGHLAGAGPEGHRLGARQEPRHRHPPVRLLPADVHPHARCDFLFNMYHSEATPQKGGRNFTYYSNPEYDKIVNEAMATPDRERESRARPPGGGDRVEGPGAGGERPHRRTSSSRART